jgi:hypothetical protein
VLKPTLLPNSPPTAGWIISFFSIEKVSPTVRKCAFEGKVVDPEPVMKPETMDTIQTLIAHYTPAEDKTTEEVPGAIEGKKTRKKWSKDETDMLVSGCNLVRLFGPFKTSTIPYGIFIDSTELETGRLF